MTLKELYKHVERLLPQRRYQHTLGVVKTAKELAEKYNVDKEKVEIAALLHDISKYMSVEEMHNCIECENTLKYYGKLGELLHGFAGSIYAKRHLGIVDEDILNAIKYHTIGRRDMSTLEKIIYIADAIEPNRNYPALEEIREKVNKDLDSGILFEIDRKIKYLLDIRAIIHPNTVEMRNWLLEKAK